MSISDRLALVMAPLALVGSAACAETQAFGTGRWRDNAPQFAATGALEVSTRSMRVGNQIVYLIAEAGSFRNGRILKVIGKNRIIDPFGCTEHKIVTYIILNSLPAPLPSLPDGLRVTFYGGANQPRPDTLAQDWQVCEVHLYRRFRRVH